MEPTPTGYVTDATYKRQRVRLNRALGLSEADQADLRRALARSIRANGRACLGENFSQENDRIFSRRQRILWDFAQAMRFDRLEMTKALWAL
jgi:hypothetical protein